MKGIDANRLRVKVLSAAARLIQHWWRQWGGAAGGTQWGGAAGAQGRRERPAGVDDRHAERLALVRDLFRAGHELQRFYLHNRGCCADEGKGLLAFIGLALPPSTAAAPPENKRVLEPADSGALAASPRLQAQQSGAKSNGAAVKAGAGERGIAGFSLPKRSAPGELDQDELLVELRAMQAMHSHLETIVLDVVADVGSFISRGGGGGGGGSRLLEDRLSALEKQMQRFSKNQGGGMMHGQVPAGDDNAVPRESRGGGYTDARASGAKQTQQLTPMTLSPSVTMAAFVSKGSEERASTSAADSRQDQAETFFRQSSPGSSSASSDSICPPTIGLIPQLVPVPRADNIARARDRHNVRGGGRGGVGNGGGGGGGIDEGGDESKLAPSARQGAARDLRQTAATAQQDPLKFDTGPRACADGSSAAEWQPTVDHDVPKQIRVERWPGAQSSGHAQASPAMSRLNARESASGKERAATVAAAAAAVSAARVEARAQANAGSSVQRRASEMQARLASAAFGGSTSGVGGVGLLEERLRSIEGSIAPGAVSPASLQLAPAASESGGHRPQVSNQCEPQVRGRISSADALRPALAGTARSSHGALPNTHDDVGPTGGLTHLDKRVQSFKAMVENSMPGPRRGSGNGGSNDPIRARNGGGGDEGTLEGHESPLSLMVTPRGTTRIHRNQIFADSASHDWTDAAVEKVSLSAPTASTADRGDSELKRGGGGRMSRGGKGPDYEPQARREEHGRSLMDALPGGRDVWETSIDRVVEDLKVKRSPRIKPAPYREKESEPGLLTEGCRDRERESGVLREDASPAASSLASTPRTSTTRGSLATPRGSRADVVNVSRNAPPGLSRLHARLL